jgi:hypothetical protein
MAVVFADTLDDIRYWIRNHPDIQPLVGSRVFFDLPDKVTYPCMRLWSLGGGAPSGATPIERWALSVEAWGGKKSDYPALRQLMTAFRSACHQIQTSELINPAGQTRVLNAAADPPQDRPDPDDGTPRLVSNCTFTVMLQPLPGTGGFNDGVYNDGVYDNG